MTDIQPDLHPESDEDWRQELRRRAETVLQLQTVNFERLSPAELKSLAHELLVYQNELEMQNHEMRLAQAELADMRDRYVRLFEFAPVGYLTLDADGNILNANLTATGLLQVERRFMTGKPFSLFLGAEEQAIFTQHQRKVLESGEQRSFELAIRKRDNSRFHAQVEISALTNQSALMNQSALTDQSARTNQRSAGIPGEEKHLLVALSDVTQRWRAEREIRDSERRLRYVLENLPVMLVAMDEQGQVIAWNAECEAVTGYDAGDIIRNPRAFTLLAPKPEDRQKLVDVLMDSQASFSDRELTLGSRDGNQRTIAWSNRSGRFPIPGWESWAVGWDISAEVAWREEQQDQRNQLETQVEERTRQLNRVVEQLKEEIKIRQQSEALLKRTNLMSTQLAKAAAHLQEVLEIPDILEVLNAELDEIGLYCSFSLVNPETSTTTFFSSSLDGDDQNMLSELLGYDLAGYQRVERLWEIFARRQLVTNAELDRLMAKAFPHMSQQDRKRVYELLGYTPDTVLATLPLLANERQVGMLWLWGDDLRRSDLPALQIFSAQLALTIERSRIIGRLQDHRERLKILTNRLVEVQEDERRYIALELHDEIGQDLTGLKMLLAGRQDGPDPSREEALAIIDRLMEIVRDLSLRLHPPMLEHMGLLPTVLWHIDRYTRLTGIQVNISHQGIKERRFTPPIENAVYRVMQEALTNISRHAQVKTASVRVWADEELITLQVEDKGLGFDPYSHSGWGKGIGLSGIAERVALLGGSLEIDSAPNQGTRINIALPLINNKNFTQEQPG